MGTRDSSKGECHILKGTTVDGSLDSERDLFLDGTVRGNVRVLGKAVLGPEAVVGGELSAVRAEVAPGARIEGGLRFITRK